MMNPDQDGSTFVATERQRQLLGEIVSSDSGSSFGLDDFMASVDGYFGIPSDANDEYLVGGSDNAWSLSLMHFIMLAGATLFVLPITLQWGLRDLAKKSTAASGSGGLNSPG